jgi:hypothetical protein
MSQLSDKIETRQLHRVAISEPASRIEVESNVVSAPDYYMYRLGVYFAIHGAAKNAQQLQFLKNSAKRQMIHEIYGEFRPMLRKLDLALMERRWEEAHAALQELENEMFS